tara:strand:- start:297 stop:632 length:336 start_codon:yes stop_codon:yes gene_type:complete
MKLLMENWEKFLKEADTDDDGYDDADELAAIGHGELEALQTGNPEAEHSPGEFKQGYEEVEREIAELHDSLADKLSEYYYGLPDDDEEVSIALKQKLSGLYKLLRGVVGDY